LSPATAERRAAAAISRGVEALTDGLRYLQRTDLRDALANVRCPVLAVHGRQDRIVPWEAGRLLGERLARCEFVLHDDAGHDLVAAAPDAQCSRVSEFLEV
jgi:pimeloyl-ACP methyl ester carboxylesterase